MSDQTHNTTNASGGGGSTGLAFIVGILVVVVALLAWVIFGGGEVAEGGQDLNITVEGVGDAVKSATGGSDGGS